MSRVVPQQLYTAEDLLAGFNPWDPIGYALSWDFSIFRQYVSDGGPVPNNVSIQLAQAEHDAGIADALRRFLRSMQRPLVGVMGGHSISRDSDAYADVARLTRRLAREGFLLVTGGGPGIMEAAHVGVAFSCFDDEGALEKALVSLAGVPKAPVLDELFENDGTIKASKMDNIRDARLWLKRAIEVRTAAPDIMPVSLAIPTWLYGAEPTTPFATHYAKYFHNSLREEALVNNSRAGIIYGRGGGGTMREIFQDVERNYYAKTTNDVTPMIFFDRGDYWRKDATYPTGGPVSAGVKLDTTVRNILTLGLRSARFPEAEVNACLDTKLKFTIDHEDIIAALNSHKIASQRNLSFALAAQPLNVTTLRMNRR
jgi:predicted Rossmann-fold nucleotide-binding protein